MTNTKNYMNYLSDAEIMKIYKENRQSGNEKMIDKYSNYVYDVIRTYYSTFHKDMADMYQQGVIGIMNAMRSYNPEKGAFTTYSTPFIKKEISKHVRFIAGESSEYFAAVHNSVNRAKSKLETTGSEISIENLMDETGLSHKIVTRELKVDHTKVSYDVLENVTSEMALSEDFMVDDMLASVDTTCREIIKSKAIEGETFSSIAKRIGITTHSVKRMYYSGLETLRDTLKVY